jgi:hypothetical protein
MLAVTGAAQMSPDSLRDRPRIRVALYWGSQWKGRSDLPDSVSMIAAMEGAQPGSFYPAWHGRPPIWIFGPTGAMPTSARTISKEGIAILSRHRIPVAIPEH